MLVLRGAHPKLPQECEHELHDGTDQPRGVLQGLDLVNGVAVDAALTEVSLEVHKPPVLMLVITLSCTV